MLMKWAIELSEFDVRYKPKTAIKGQVLADFLMEFTSTEPAENAQTTTDSPSGDSRWTGLQMHKEAESG